MTTVQPGRYRHYKGNEYTLVGVALHSETQEELVVYRQEYGDHGLWVRPKQMFLETVTVDGRDVPRFHPLGSSSEQVGDSIKNTFDGNLSRRSSVPPTCESSGSSRTATPHPPTSGTTSR
jgi:hypothetical protein